MTAGGTTSKKSTNVSATLSDTEKTAVIGRKLVNGFFYATAFAKEHAAKKKVETTTILSFLEILENSTPYGACALVRCVRFLEGH